MNGTRLHRNRKLWATLLVALSLLPNGATEASESLRARQEAVTRQSATSVTLRTPQAVRAAFESTGVVTKDQGSVPFPALVSDKLYIRGFDISPAYDPLAGDREHVRQTFALGRAGIGRWFVFTGGHDLIERVLVSGQHNATQVFQDIGYGLGFQCQPDHFYWLVVFQQSAAVKPMPGVYAKLDSWFRHVYQGNAPRINAAAVETLESERFGALSGCPLNEQGYFDSWRDLDRCHPDFTQVVKAAWANNRCANPNALRYKPAQGCPTDQVLQQLGRNPDPRRLRAYLYAVDNFSEFYTGYGYTASAYHRPIGREYWTDNSWVRNLPKGELLRVQCDLPTDGTQSLRSKPTVKPQSTLVEQY